MKQKDISTVKKVVKEENIEQNTEGCMWTPLTNAINHNADIQ